MSRINLIPPKDLYDQHLMAEFREIRHIGKALQRSLNRKKTPFNKNEIPKKFKLNKGHVKFFYNKGYFLHKRFIEIKQELLNRNFNINKNTKFNNQDFPKDFYNDWSPTKEEIKISMCRINKRLNEKKNFYKKTPNLNQ